MSSVRALIDGLVASIREGDGQAPREQRCAAFANAGLTGPVRTLVDKVASRARDVHDEDIAAARASGSSEDQIFELVVCAAVGQAMRQYASARADLDATTRSE